MHQKAAQEFFGCNCHFALLVAVRIVLPAEGDLAIRQGDEAVIGDSHPMRVAGQILEHVFWSAEWRLGINHPVLTEQLAQKAVKCFRLPQSFEPSLKAELLLPEKALQPSDELAAKDAA